MGCEYRVTHLSVCLFYRTAHLLVCSAQLALLARSAALICLLARSLHSQACGKVGILMSQNQAVLNRCVVFEVMNYEVDNRNIDKRKQVQPRAYLFAENDRESPYTRSFTSNDI